jgi:hypothetical protein
LALVAALPALLAAATSVGASWTPAADHAPIEVRVRDVTSADPPLVGVFSRVGGNHPGPALFYALAVPYRLLGSQPSALLVGAALGNAAAMAAAVRIAGRRGRVGLAAATAALVLAGAWSLGPDFLRDPWNPYVALFSFLAATLASWAVTCGSRRALPVAAATASFCLQAHVGYLLLVAVLAGWCLIGVWMERADLRRWRGPGLLTAALLVLLWAPVVGQQVFGPSGNLSRIVANTSDTDDEALGIDGAAARVLPELGPRPTWPRPGSVGPLELHRGLGGDWPPLGLAAFSGAALVAARRRDRDPLLLLGLTATLWVAGAISLTRISGLPAAYLFLWLRALGLLLWLSALWPLTTAALRALDRRGADRRRPLRQRHARAGVSIGVVALCLLAVAVSLDQIRTPFADDPLQRGSGLVAAEAVQAAAKSVPPGSTVQVRTSGSVVFVAPAAVAALERSGFDVITGEGEGDVWGRHRLPGRSVADLDLIVTTGDPDTLIEAGTASRLVATVDLLTPDERREWQAIGPRSPRCADLVREAVASPADAPSGNTPSADAELEACRRHDELRFRSLPIAILVAA